MLLINRSQIHHFTCDVIVTSFYMELKPNFNITSTVYSGMCVPSFVRASAPSRCGVIARKKMGAEICPPASGGWRGGLVAAGLMPPIDIF